MAKKNADKKEAPRFMLFIVTTLVGCLKRQENDE
jgi:hypothetical protein